MTRPSWKWQKLPTLLNRQLGVGPRAVLAARQADGECREFELVPASRGQRGGQLPRRCPAAAAADRLADNPAAVPSFEIFGFCLICVYIPYNGIPLGICLCVWPAMHISKSQMLTVEELQRFKVYKMFDIVT